MAWFKRQWQELRSHAKWDALKAIMLTVFYPLLQKARHLQWDWWVFGSIFVLSFLALLFLDRKRTSAQTSPQSASNALIGIDLDAKSYLEKSHKSFLEPEVEARIRAIAARAKPDNAEDFYVKLLTKGAIFFTYDTAWLLIYRSQLLLLNELNRRILPIGDAKSFYDRAASDRANVVYRDYTFDQWMNFLKVTLLLHVHPSAMVEITPRGKDFLKYLVHQGRSPEDRKY